MKCTYYQSSNDLLDILGDIEFLLPFHVLWPGEIIAQPIRRF